LRSVAVVGASLAGLRASEALRQEGFAGRITLMGAEQELPYDRPPLSKQVLAGTWEPDRIRLRTETELASLELDLRLGERATALDLGQGHVELAGGDQVGFDGLVIATGASPRRLPRTPELEGVHALRTLDDCLAIRAGLQHGPRVVVVGAGFIGSEVAATCRGRGLEVTVVEALPVPLGRALGDELGAVCGALHRDHGVDLRVGLGVAGFEGTDRVEGVRLADGEVIAADLVVVGVGVTPNTDWLESSGLELGDGVVCDATCLAAPGVVAAGDVARWPNPLFATSMRIEHWTNASDQATHAAHTLLSGPNGAEPYAPVPYVWSDQYDIKIQFVGHCRPEDEVRVVYGSVEQFRFVAAYRRGERVVAAIGFNAPRVLMKYRNLVAGRAAWEDALVPET
jgi:3-phenylpropionate/trans-cinnamate dioxygenase ferredoxin reductase component